MSGLTGITYIRGSGKEWTALLKIIIAVELALGTEGTFFKAAVRIRAKMRDRTAETVGAVIKRASKATGFFESKMIADLFRDRSAVPAKSPCDRFKRASLIKH